MICILVLIPQSICNLQEYVEELDLEESLDAPSRIFWVLGLSLVMLPCWDINRAIDSESGTGVVHLFMFIFVFVYLFCFGLLYGILIQSYITKCRQIAYGTNGAAIEEANHLYEQYLVLKDGCQLGLFTSFAMSTLYLIITSYCLLIILLFSCLLRYRTLTSVTNLGLQVAAFTLNLFYYGWTADKCFQSFKGLTVPLRYLYE